MKPFWLALFALIAPWLWIPAAAADSASGHYEEAGVTIRISHVLALSQDNAEGKLDHPGQIRVLLSEQVAGPQSLFGMVFPPVTAEARQGQVRGLLLEFDPADRTAMTITVLDRPKLPSETLKTISLSNSEGLWRRLDVGPTRVAGEYQSTDDSSLAFAFDAALLFDPVVADLRGPQAQASAPLKVLVARAEALSRGDMSAAAALSTAESGAELRSLPSQAISQIPAQAAELLRELKAVKRVVVRRQTAAVIMDDGGWQSLVLEDGAWKVD